MPTPRRRQREYRSALLLGLVAYYKFEDTPLDVTARGNDLTAVSSPTYTTGQVGRCASLASASGQYFSLANNVDTTLGGGNFTIGCAVNLTTSATFAIVAKWNDDVNQREYFLGHVSSRYTLFVSSNGTAQTNINADAFGAPPTGAWHYIQAWHDQDADTINIRVNGGAVNSTSFSSGVFASSAGLKIGANRATPVNVLNGKVDDVKLWKRALTLAELNTDWTNVASGKALL